jgi:hypothetical protein
MVPQGRRGPQHRPRRRHAADFGCFIAGEITQWRPPAATVGIKPE